MRCLWIGLLGAICSFSQTVEHPIPQPNVYGWNFAGPALALKCVGALKTDAAKFPKYFAAKRAPERRVCLDQLLQSLTPEPDFTSGDVFRIIAQNPNHNLAPADSSLGLRIRQRTGVNIEVAKALGSLAAGGLIDDPAVLTPLIRCLDHPLLPVNQICQETLFTLTRHDFVRPFRFPRWPPETFEGRRQLIADWQSWQRQMQGGHPLFDDRLQNLLLISLEDVITRLAVILQNPYVSQWTKEKQGLNLEDPILFWKSVSRDGVGGGWPPVSTFAELSIRAFRPGLADIPRPGLEPGRFRGKPEDTYRERLPSLDLEVEFSIVTSDAAKKNASFRAVKDALAALRQANNTGRL